MSHYPVLIVGAGPTGLALAAELSRYEIDFLIIDKRPNPVTTSNAAGIHARTLECWHGRPWVDTLLKQGVAVQDVTINAKRHCLAKFNFGTLQQTQYPMILSIPQNQTEAALDDYLTSIQKPVQRNTLLLDLISDDQRVTARLATPDGETSVTADWVIGCDGYHSTVREITKIPFLGKDIKERFFLVDAEFQADYAPNAYHIYLDAKGILALFMMRGSTRIIAGVGHDPEFKEVEQPTYEVINEIIKQRSSLTFTMGDIRWKSHFWIHECLANQYKMGRMFLAGDAAHVHSPAGGQGMNTGIQDAYNLAWKLAYVIQQKSPMSLLESYEAERRPIAKQVIKMTSNMTRLANVKQPILVSLRNFLAPYITEQSFIQQRLVGSMSQLILQYQKSAMIAGKTISSLSPGERAPDGLMDDKTHLYDVLNSTTHHLLVFHASNEDKQALRDLGKKYLKTMEMSFYDHLDGELLKTYPFQSFTLCLIRPDHYIGYLGDQFNEFKSYMNVMFR